MTAAELVARVTGTVDYLRVTIGRDGDGWIPCEPLVTDPERLGELVASTRAGRGTDRDDVAMSLFVQGYTFRIASLAIGGWVTGDAVLDVSPPNAAIALGRDRPNAVALDVACLLEGDDPLDRLHRSLIDGHLAPLVATAHDACRIGEPLLWGNVAAGCASSFAAFGTAMPDRAREVRDRASAFLATGRPELSGAGEMVAVGEQRWFWERRSCCLWYRTESGFLCEDCSLRSDDDRRARYTAALAEEAAS